MGSLKIGGQIGAGASFYQLRHHPHNKAVKRPANNEFYPQADERIGAAF
jgi:hypothetical protein